MNARASSTLVASVLVAACVGIIARFAPAIDRTAGIEGAGAAAMVTDEPAMVLSTGMLTTGEYGPRPASIANPEGCFTPVFVADVGGFHDREMPVAVRPDRPWVTREIEAPGVSFHTFESPAAKARASYHLFSPLAYEREPQRRFPVVYWLHGSRGGLAGIPQVAARFAAAIDAGHAPPCLVVFVNGLVEGMYVDWKDGSAPVETVIVKELVPHIDASHRTIAGREGRLLDGYSMGGYGAARLGFKYPDLFRAVSIMGGGPLQADLLADAPRAGRRRAEEVLERVYGGDPAHFRNVSPCVLAERNAAAIAQGSFVRVVCGERDETFANNRDFHEHLQRLGIPHAWTVLPGVGHDPAGTLTALGDANWVFYRQAFGQFGR